MEKDPKHLVNSFMRESRWDDAIRVLQLALAEQPIHALFQAQLGYCQFMLGRFREAEQAFRCATMIDTDFWRAGRMHAECLDRLGRYEDALLVAEHWRIKAPNDPYLETLLDGLRRQVANDTGQWTKSLVANHPIVEFTQD